jgi:putative transcriptional regulator
MFISKAALLLAEKEFRERRRITQEEIAEATGIRRPTISVWMGPRPIRRLDAETVVAFCRFFNCGLTDLVDLDMGQRLAVA